MPRTRETAAKPMTEAGTAGATRDTSHRGRRGASRAESSTEARAADREPLRLIGYVRVSTREQGNGHGLDAQRAAIERYCEEHGHRLVTIVPDVMTTRSVDKLYGRLAAVAAVEAGLADGLVISTLDRATRSTLDGAQLLDAARRKGWRLLSVDGTDTADAGQALLTDIRIAVAQEERRKISERTKAGLAAAKAKGVHVGRPRRIPPEVADRIVFLASEGASSGAIARTLDAERVPTPGGGRTWYPSVVRDVLRREG